MIGIQFQHQLPQSLNQHKLKEKFSTRTNRVFVDLITKTAIRIL